MRALSPSELLDAWERGLNGPPANRSLELLSAACSEFTPEAVATLSIGERDRRLVALRDRTFGPHLVSVATCAKCGERLEWAVDAGDLQVRNPPDAVGDLSLQSSGYRVRFRLPNTRDLEAAAGCKSVAAARRLLLESCLLRVERDDQQLSAADLPAEVIDAIAGRMVEADPQADTEFELTCPACGYRWTILFDIESFFWSELSGWAQRVLTEVHTLASAYGWRETDILRLGPRRRQFYLSLIGA